MDLKSLIAFEHSKKQALRIVRFIGNDQKKFNELVSIVCGTDELLAQRASYPLGICVEKNPALVKKHLKKLIHELRLKKHNAIRRSVSRLLEFVEIPKSLEGEIISVCFDRLNDPEEFVAVKVFSMSAIARLSKKYPDLKKELKASVDSQMQYQTAAFHSRARKII